MAEPYRFRIAGRLSPELLETFRPVHADIDAGSTVFVTAVRDQTELFSVIARCETLGLKLIGLDALDALDAETAEVAPALRTPARGGATNPRD